MATYEGFSEIRTGVFMEQGQKFRLIRKQRHLTIKQLAEVASSVASISDFENGKTSLSNDNLFKLLRYLRVEYNEFFDNDLLLDKSFQELANDFNKAMFEKDVASLEKCCHAFEQLGNNNPIDKIISFLLIFGQMWILVCWIWLKQFLM